MPHHFFSSRLWVSVFLLIIYSVSYSTAVFGSTDNYIDNNTYNNTQLSFGASLVMPEGDKLQNADSFHLQITSKVKSFQVGLEVAIQHHAPADYSYRVPFNSAIEERYINTYSGFILLRYSPWHKGYITPYFGGYFGGSYVLDNAPGSPHFDDHVSTDKILQGGPIIGIEILPLSFISLFFEARKAFQIMGHLQRPEIVSVDSVGNITQKNSEYKIDAISLTAGFRFNF